MCTQYSPFVVLTVWLSSPNNLLKSLWKWKTFAIIELSMCLFFIPIFFVVVAVERQFNAWPNTHTNTQEKIVTNVDLITICWYQENQARITCTAFYCCFFPFYVFLFMLGLSFNMVSNWHLPMCHPYFSNISATWINFFPYAVAALSKNCNYAGSKTNDIVNLAQ